MPSTNSQRVFLAGASGVIGQRLIPRLIRISRRGQRRQIAARVGLGVGDA